MVCNIKGGSELEGFGVIDKVVFAKRSKNIKHCAATENIKTLFSDADSNNCSQCVHA